jgi:hypothetical protein
VRKAEGNQVFEAHEPYSGKLFARVAAGSRADGGRSKSSYLVYLVKLSCTMFKEDPFMKATSSELLMRNFNEIFIELDPLKRAALLAESYTEDCLWIHPGGRIVGREGINEAATEIRKHFPEYRYSVTGEIQIMHNVATCRWGSGMPGQPFHYTGTDFLEERDGRVSRLYTFIDQKLFQS